MFTKNSLIWGVWALLVGLLGFLLADTFLLPYWLAVVQIGVWWFLWQAQRKLPVWCLVAGILLLIGLGLNVFATQVLPGTLQGVLRWLLVLELWWLGILRSPTTKLIPWLWYGSVLLLSAVVSISLATWIFPSLQLIPGLNLLYATFGHSHIVVLILLGLPLVVLGDQLVPSQWWRWGLLGLVAVLCTSFGRVAMVITVLELLVLSRWLPRFSQIKKTVQISGISLAIVMLITVGWSAWLGMGGNCFIPKSFKTQLCKSFHSEQRPEYFRQAWESITHHAWTGTGLNTFHVISLQERTLPWGYSAYVHNDYLQWMVELGVPIGLFLTVGLWWTWLSCRPVGTAPETQTLTFQRAIWLGVGALLCNSLLDMDLHYTSVLCLVALWLGWLVGWQDMLQKNGARRVQRWLTTSIVTVSAVLLLSWAGMYVVTNYWWQQGQVTKVAETFPYFGFHSHIFVQHFAELSLPTQQKIIRLYENEPEIMRLLLAEQLEDSRQKYSPETFSLLQHIYYLDPWSRLELQAVASYIESENWPVATVAIRDLDTFFTTKTAETGVTMVVLNDQLRWQLAKQFVQLANHAMKTKDSQAAAAFLVQANKYEPWAVAGGEYCTIWRQQQGTASIPRAELKAAFTTVATLNPTHFGSCQTDFAQILLQELTLDVAANCKSGDCQWLADEAWKMSNQADWMKASLRQLHQRFSTAPFRLPKGS
jgi:hypothetical protein